MKAFPKLMQDRVTIDLGGNKHIDVGMLPIRCIDEIRDIGDTLDRISNADPKEMNKEEELEKVRQRMIALVKMSLPEEYCINLPRFKIDQLIDLISYLMYGEDAKEAPEEKN